MSIFRKVAKDASKQAGSLLGNAVAENARQATSSAVKGMDLFRKVVEKKQNVAFDQAKGNLRKGLARWSRSV